MDEYERNSRLADQICRDLEYRGRRYSPGQWLAILDDEVVAVGASLEEVAKQRESIPVHHHRGMIFEVGPQPEDVIRRAN